MKILIKSALIISILACASALYLTFQLGNQRQQLRDERETLTAKNSGLQRDLSAKTTELTATLDKLNTTLLDLDTTKRDLETANTTLNQANEELKSVKDKNTELATELDTNKGKVTTLEDELAKAKQAIELAGGQDLEKTRQELAEVKKARDALNGELRVLTDKLKTKEADIERLNVVITDLQRTPENLRGKVALVQPEWGFVVLDIGHKHRVQPDAEFLVYRNDGFITKVKVVDVKESACVARILSSFQQKPAQIGDDAVH